MAKAKQIKVTLVKSIFGQLKAHRATVRGLGLRHIRDTATVADTPEIRGMIRASGHLLKVEEQQ
jgi:large subunit ribosomal protein L30